MKTDPFETHRRSDHPYYKRWNGIRHSCCIETSAHYPNVGGRGIKMDPAWQEMKVGFDQFVSDITRYLGPMPFPTAKLNRQDITGDFMISNLRWTTPKGVSNNRNENLRITFKRKGHRYPETKTLAEWARITGIEYSCLFSRIKDYGMTPEEAFGHEWYSRTNKKTV